MIRRRLDGSAPPSVSVVIPAYNEAPCIRPLHAEIQAAFAGFRGDWEMVWIDDGSLDETWLEIKELARTDERVSGIRLRKNQGKACALRTGFLRARGQAILTMDADLQDDPGEGPLLLERLEAGCEMVVAWRHPRADALHKRIASALYNGVVSYSSGLHLHDHNCGLKALTKEAALTLPLYGDLHRYMSVLAANEGFRVSEVEVRHRPRAFGRSKYTTLRLVTSLLDFIAVFFLLRYAKRPLRLLGFCGLALTGLGAAALFYLAVSWCQGHSIGHRPLLVYATVVSIFGLNVSVLGIIGELLVWSLDRSVRLAPDPLVSEDTPAVVPRAAVCSPTLA